MKAVCALLLVTLVSCSSKSPDTHKDMVYEPDKVLGRSDELEKRPEWVKESVNVVEKEDHIAFIGFSEVPGDSRVTAAYKMADSEAKGSIASKLRSEIFKLVETSDTGLKMEDQKLESLIQDMSEVELKNVDVKDRYWEKVQRTASDGKKSMVMKVFSLIEVKKDELQKLMLQKAKESDAPSDMKNKVEEAIRAQWQD